MPTSSGPALPAIRKTKIDGVDYLVVGCAVIPLDRLAWIAWNGAKVEAYVVGVPGGLNTWATKADLEAYIASGGN